MSNCGCRLEPDASCDNIFNLSTDAKLFAGGLNKLLEYFCGCFLLLLHQLNIFLFGPFCSHPVKEFNKCMYPVE